jgi:recombination protein RecA
MVGVISGGVRACAGEGEAQPGGFAWCAVFGDFLDRVRPERLTGCSGSDILGSLPGISTGALSLDLALGGLRHPPRAHRRDLRPGVERQDDARPARRANAQKAGGVAAFIDAEHALDPSWAKRSGVNIDEPARQPARHRRAGAGDLRDARALQRGGRHRDRLGRRADPQGRDRGRDGRHARRPAGPPHEPGDAQAHRRIASSNCTVVFINQIREKIGVMFGNPETTPGGRALKFYASVRIDIRRIGSIKDGDNASATACGPASSRTRSPRPSATPSSTSCSTRASAPRATCSTWRGRGRPEEARGSATARPRSGQGRENAKQFLKDNPDNATAEHAEGPEGVDRLSEPMRVRGGG